VAGNERLLSGCRRIKNIVLACSLLKLLSSAHARTEKNGWGCSFTSRDFKLIQSGYSRAPITTLARPPPKPVRHLGGAIWTVSMFPSLQRRSCIKLDWVGDLAANLKKATFSGRRLSRDRAWLHCSQCPDCAGICYNSFSCFTRSLRLWIPNWRSWSTKPAIPAQLYLQRWKAQALHSFVFRDDKHSLYPPDVTSTPLQNLAVVIALDLLSCLNNHSASLIGGLRKSDSLKWFWIVWRAMSG